MRLQIKRGDVTPRRRHIGQSSCQYSLCAVATQVEAELLQLPSKWRMPTSPVQIKGANYHNAGILSKESNNIRQHPSHHHTMVSTTMGNSERSKIGIIT